MDNYSDIINHSHHVSKKHPQMPMEKRAAQFAPFAAVSGHKESVDEAARYTETKAELTEEKIRDLNEKLLFLKEGNNAGPEVSVLYFKDDPFKAGGKYLEAKGRIKKIDEHKHVLIMESGDVISMDHIQDIRGSIFEWQNGF